MDHLAVWKSWSAELELTPENLPILRHAQFEDLLNGTFADPVSSILRVVKPEEGIRCLVAIQLVPACRRRQRTAERVFRLLDREFFRRWAPCQRPCVGMFRQHVSQIPESLHGKGSSFFHAHAKPWAWHPTRAAQVLSRSQSEMIDAESMNVSSSR